MTQAGGPIDPDQLAETLALAMLQGEEKADARPLPIKSKEDKKANKEYLRARALKILEYRIKGHSFDEIAQILDYKSGKHVQSAYQRFMDKFEKEDVATLRQLQSERLEYTWRSLVPAIGRGSPRAAEVGMKVMDRQARLHGLDVADQAPEKNTNQPIQINIMAHPGDQRAQEMIIEHQSPPKLLEESNPTD
jgi:hypothetical protein